MQGRGPSLAENINSLLETASPDKCWPTNSSPQVQAEMGNAAWPPSDPMGCCPATHSSLQGHPAWLGLLWIRAKRRIISRTSMIYFSPSSSNTHRHTSKHLKISLKTSNPKTNHFAIGNKEKTLEGLSIKLKVAAALALHLLRTCYTVSPNPWVCAGCCQTS